MRNYKREIYNIMRDLDAPMDIGGYHYASWLINAMLTGEISSVAKTMELYNAIAKEFNTTYPRAERVIRHFIEKVFERAKTNTLEKYFGKATKPTNSQFVHILVEYLKFNEVLD